jgi:hypothetical protein
MPYKSLERRRERQKFLRQFTSEEKQALKKEKQRETQLILIAVKESKTKRKCLRKELAWRRRNLRKKAYFKTEKGRALRRAISKRYLQNNPHAREAKREWKKRWFKTEKGREAQRKKNRTLSHLACKAVKKAKERALEKEMTDFDKFVYKEAFKLRLFREELFGTKWHIDHTIPISIGGTNAYNNIEVVPAKWNLDKSNKHSERYFK